MFNKNNNTIILFLFSSIIIGISIYETIPLYTDISKLFMVSQTSAIKTSSFFSLGYALGFLSVAPLLNKFDSRLLLSSALLLLALSTFVISYVNNFSILLFLRFLQGIFSSFFAPIAFASVVELVSSKQVPIANSMITSGFVISSVVGQIFSNLLFKITSWQGIFITQSIMVLVLACILFNVLPSLPKLNKKVSYFSTIRHVFNNYRLMIQYYVTFILLFSFVSMYSLIATNHLIHQGQLMEFRLWGLSGIVLGMLTTLKIDTSKNHAYTSYALLISALGSLILVVWHTSTLLIIGSILFAYGVTMSLPLVVSNIEKFSNKNDISVTIVLYTFVLFIGATVGPIVTKIISNATGNSSYPFLFITTLFIIGSALELKKYNHR